MKSVAIILFAAVIILLVIRRYKYTKYIEWLEQRATETAKLYHYSYEHGNDSHERIECECGFVVADDFYSGQRIKGYSYYEGKICSCCHRRRGKPEYVGWGSMYGRNDWGDNDGNL